MFTASLGLNHHLGHGDSGPDDPIRQALRRSSRSYHSEAGSPHRVETPLTRDNMSNPFAVLSMDEGAADGGTTAKKGQVEAEDMDVDVSRERALRSKVTAR